MKIALVFCLALLMLLAALMSASGQLGLIPAGEADDEQQLMDDRDPKQVEVIMKKRTKRLAAVLPAALSVLSKLTSVFGKLNSGVEFVSTISTIFDFVSNGGASSSKEYETSERILEGVTEIKSIVERTERRVEHLVGLSHFLHLKSQLAESRLRIKGSFEALHDYLLLHTEFTRQQLLKNTVDINIHIKQVFDYVLGKGHDALQALHEYHKDSRLGFLKDAGKLLSLAAQGVFVEASLMELNGTSAIDSDRSHKKKKYCELERTAKARIRDFEAKYEDETEVANKIKGWLEDNKRENFTHMADILRDNLAKRWDTKSWLVVVYHPFAGLSKHTIGGNFSAFVKRESGFTVLATSFDSKRTWNMMPYNRYISDQYCPAKIHPNPEIYQEFIPYRWLAPHVWLVHETIAYMGELPRCANPESSAETVWDELRNMGYVPKSFKLAVIKDKEAAFSISYLMNPRILNNEWREYNGHWFWDSTFKLNWQDARNFCRNVLGGDLAVLASYAKHNAVNGMFQTYQEPAVWHWRHIGLARDNRTGSFSWVDGTPLTFSQFLDGQPGEDGNACAIAAFYTGMGYSINVKSLSTWPCTSDQLHHFVCERSPRVVADQQHGNNRTKMFVKADPETKQAYRTDVSTGNTTSCSTEYGSYIKENGFGPLIHRHMPEACPFNSSLCYGTPESTPECIFRSIHGQPLSILALPSDV